MICFDGDRQSFHQHLSGLFRWPVDPRGEPAGELTVGPPQRLPFPVGDRGVATSRDGRVIAQARMFEAIQSGEGRRKESGWPG